jgi:hypothetical protein
MTLKYYLNAEFSIVSLKTQLLQYDSHLYNANVHSTKPCYPQEGLRRDCFRAFQGSRIVGVDFVKFQNVLRRPFSMCHDVQGG